VEDDLAPLADPPDRLDVMHANNEIGTVQDVQAIGRICKERQVIFHTDVAQSAGKIPLDVNDLGLDLASMSAHKIYGPKGVGALFIRRRNPRVVLTPLIDGGGHERGIRSGTVNVPGIVGFGMACEIARLEMAAESRRVGALRDTLCRLVTTQLDEVSVNGDREPRLPGHLNLSFAYCEGESLLLGLRGLAVSTGSACTSASLEPSHVLKAIGVTEDLAHGSIRFTLGRFNTESDVESAAAMVVGTVRRLRDLSPLYEMMREGRTPPESRV
jgi:cysteine desulfurase